MAIRLEKAGWSNADLVQARRLEGKIKVTRYEPEGLSAL